MFGFAPLEKINPEGSAELSFSVVVVVLLLAGVVVVVVVVVRAVEALFREVLKSFVVLFVVVEVANWAAGFRSVCARF